MRPSGTARRRCSHSTGVTQSFRIKCEGAFSHLRVELELPLLPGFDAAEQKSEHCPELHDQGQSYSVPRHRHMYTCSYLDRINRPK